MRKMSEFVRDQGPLTLPRTLRSGKPAEACEIAASVLFW